MDLAQVQLDLRILELDLRFRGGLGLSPPLKFSSPIGLRPSPPLNLKSNSKIPKSHCKPSDFGFFCWSWAPKSIIGAGDLDAGGVLTGLVSHTHICPDYEPWQIAGRRLTYWSSEQTMSQAPCWEDKCRQDAEEACDLESLRHTVPTVQHIVWHCSREDTRTMWFEFTSPHC